MPERRLTFVRAPRRVGSPVAALEAVIGADDRQRAIAGERHDVRQHLVLILVAAFDGLREGRVVLSGDLRPARRRVLHEQMTAGVDRLEVDAKELGPILALQPAGDSPVVLRRRVDTRELADAALAVYAERRAARDKSRASRGGVRRRRSEPLLQRCRKVRRERCAFGRLLAGDLMKREAIRDLEAAHPLGRERRVPADEP